MRPINHKPPLSNKKALGELPNILPLVGHEKEFNNGCYHRNKQSSPSSLNNNNVLLGLDSDNEQLPSSEDIASNSLILLGRLKDLSRPSILDKGLPPRTATNKKLEMKDAGRNFELASELPTKPKSQPQGYTGQNPLDSIIRNPQKFQLRESIKRNNILNSQGNRQSKLEESGKSEKPLRHYNVFVENAQQALVGKPVHYSPKRDRSNGSDVDSRGNLFRDKSPYSKCSGITLSSFKSRTPNKIGGSPILSKSRKLFVETPKEDMFKRELKPLNIPRNIQNNSRCFNKSPSVVETNHNKKGKSPRNQSLIEEKKPALILFDHDLGFLKEYLLSLKVPYEFSFDKLEHYGTSLEKEVNDPRDFIKEDQPAKSQTVLIFLKFSPRVKRQSLKFLQLIVRKKNCLVIKCLLDVELVDLHLDYENEAITSEKKKQIEHVLYLERETFDSYTVGNEALTKLESFLLLKLKEKPVSIKPNGEKAQI